MEKMCKECQSETASKMFCVRVLTKGRYRGLPDDKQRVSREFDNIPTVLEDDIQDLLKIRVDV